MEHGYFGAVNMRPNCVRILFIRQGAEACFLHMEAEFHPHYASEACHTLKISHSCIFRRLWKAYSDGFRKFKTSFCKTRNHLGKTDFTNIYCKVQRIKTGNYYSLVFFLVSVILQGQMLLLIEKKKNLGQNSKQIVGYPK